MRDLLIVFFIISLIFLIIIFPFKTRVMGHLNLVDMKCYYSVKSWIVKLLCGKILLENGKIDIENEKTFLSKTYNSDFVKYFGKAVVSEIEIKKIELFLKKTMVNGVFIINNT